MVVRIGSSRRKSRHKMTKHKSQRGKINITRYLQSFNVGDAVVLKVESSVHKGCYPLRFHGRVAIVKNRRKSCYEVSLIDGGKEKTLIVHPVHLQRLAK